jgi:glycyl-tRNA synthetase beta chain
MSEVRDLLIEIGTEELPPRALPGLAAAFADLLVAGIDRAGFTRKTHQWLATPRRLAAIVRDIASRQPDQNLERRGPALAAAFDKAGNPTSAATGFARSCGVEVAQLERLESGKGTWLIYRAQQPGRALTELLPGIIESALNGLPIGKRMRWGTGTAEFVRPVHWAVVLYGAEIVPCEVLGIPAGRHSRGHRFHHPGPIEIHEPKGYAASLREHGHVIADFNERRSIILESAEAEAKKTGGSALINPDLLDEITALVEWPTPITGTFDEKFLELPPEVLIATMQMHQKYFPIVRQAESPTEDSGLLAAFVTIANIESPEPAAIRKGNERVIRPRLTDADFFWRRDTAQSLASRRPMLAQVVYQQSLGTLADKTERIAALAGYVARELGGDVEPALRSAQLCKCDLLTDMVGEFPELQGIMGYHYALHDSEPREVAIALKEQYLPKQAGGALPLTPTGRILAIAEKLDTLTGIFAIGQAPSGDRDPFGLRRAALGCLRILIEGRLDLDLRASLDAAAAGYGAVIRDRKVMDEVFAFMMERLRRYYLDSGITVDAFEAVLANQPASPHDFNLRIMAVADFRALPAAASLTAANKRIRNILKQSTGVLPPAIDTRLLTDNAEKALVGELEAALTAVEPLLVAREYGSALSRLAGIREGVDAFFDQVLVMSDDPSVRANRLAILIRLGELFQSVADISRLQG